MRRRKERKIVGARVPTIFLSRTIRVCYMPIIKYYRQRVALFEFIATFAPEMNVEGFGLIATTIKNC